MRQQFVTGLLAALMLFTIVMLPTRFHSKTTYSASVVRQVGMVTVRPEVSAELPHGQVRDLTH